MRFARPARAFLFLALCLPGCSSRTDKPPLDEAARWNADMSPAVIAQDVLIPNVKYDYFDGMDPLAVPNENQIPHQLLDHVRDWDKDPEVLAKHFVTPRSPVYNRKVKAETAKLTESEIFGRNAWLIWCGGNERFWDSLASNSLGVTDILKVVDSRMRTTRFRDMGLINEPKTREAAAPGPNEFGLWLDQPTTKDAQDFRKEYLRYTFSLIAERKHPSQRGSVDRNNRPNYFGDGQDFYADKNNPYPKEVPPPHIYGLSSGVLGIRLFPNPEFDAAAQRRWDADRYYADEAYYSDPKLIRPFRVGLSCGICHVSFHPLMPPVDILNPQWENISGNIGAQYLRARKVFGYLLETRNFVYHVLDSQPPGTIDTSLIPSDNINNPNAMNSIFQLEQRLIRSFENPLEKVKSSLPGHFPSIWGNVGSTMDISKKLFIKDTVPKELSEAFKSLQLAEKIGQSNGLDRHVPHVLFDGADSVGAWGSLSRVYLNIGTYSEQWERIHNPIVGFKKQEPFLISDLENNSAYWHAIQLRVPSMRDYFLKISSPMRLLDTDNAVLRVKPIDSTEEKDLEAKARQEKLDFTKLKANALAKRVDVSKLSKGRRVFAENCIVCHSSIQPESPASDPEVLFARKDKRDETKEELKAKEEYKAVLQEAKGRREAAVKQWASAGEFWDHEPSQWFSDPDYVTWARIAVEQPNFWKENYLSTDNRVPVNFVGTNSARAMATNALKNRMWSDFSSEGYQVMPPIGAMRYFNPYSKNAEQFTPRQKVSVKDDSDEARNEAGQVPEGGGGVGFYRVPSLVSIWATAPLLHNNSVGNFNNDPSVDGRLVAFDDAIRKFLWPERRLQGSNDSTGKPLNDATVERLKADTGLIWRTSDETYLTLRGRFVPSLLFGRAKFYQQLIASVPWLERSEPAWLVSALLFVGSLLLLLIECSKPRSRLGIALLVIGVLWLIGAWTNFFNWEHFSKLREIEPPYLPGWTLILMGLICLALIDRPITRRFGILLLAVGGIGLLTAILGLVSMGIRELIVYTAIFLAIGSMVLSLLWPANSSQFKLLAAYLGVFAIVALVVHWQWDTIKKYDLETFWLPSLILFLAGFSFYFLFASDHRKLIRFSAYGELTLAIVLGGVIYFLNGKINEVRIGPIPPGTPVNLLASINPDANESDLIEAVNVAINTFAEIKSKHLDPMAAKELIERKLGPALLKVSKCPDFVMDHGHDFSWFRNMSDADKDALIELLKTF
jgi:mono/diheme cytochrome c family protein